MTVDNKILALRQEMKKKAVDAVIISSSDPHQSEYLADRWKDREWISGFTGSSGFVVVTNDHSGLWTDSRYFIQAEKELSNSEIQLHKINNQFAPEYIEWLRENLKAGAVIALDGEDFSKTQLDNIETILKTKNISISSSLDLISSIWQDRPILPKGKVTKHALAFTGQSRIEKIEAIRQEIIQANCDDLLIPALDEIAWLFNIRGNDVEFNPVAVAYAYITKYKAHLFIDKSKLDEDLSSELSNEGVEIFPYDTIISYLNNLAANTTIMVDTSAINAKLFKAINGRINEKESPVKKAKAIKTPKEINHYKQTMIYDGAAIANAFKWLEDSIVNEEITEYGFGHKIAAYRAQHNEYIGESFNPIVGYNENGAIIHYHAIATDSKKINAQGVLLIDCGGQYFGGTTDITRTLGLSEPSKEIKKHYTLVLKGHIALSQAIFPQGTCGATLDILARQFLWEHGLNYQHGTGHGVGYFLNVHEGPHGFAGPNTERGRTAFAPGMVITNEPGFYLENNYGIRIENILVVKENKTSNFLEFETITLYPYDLKMIDEQSLTSKEKAWINNYHNHVFNQIGPHLDATTREWFRFKCKLLG